jgi:transposase
MDSLELEEFNVLHIDQNDEYRIYEVEPKDYPFFCSLCMYSDADYLNYLEDKSKFKYYDTRIREVKDVDDVDGRKVVIKIHQRRFTCPFCGKVFSEFFTSVCRRDKVTVRLWERMGKEVLKEKNTFRTVGRRYGVSPTTVARAFKEHVDVLDKDRVIKAPTVLGIDEVFVKTEEGKRKQALGVFTDIKNSKVLEIIQGNDRDSVINVIKSMIGYEDIKVVTMDMNSTYKVAVEMTLPNAYCVVDHYHVIQKINMAMDTIRASIQSKLKEGEKDALFKVRDMVKADREKLNENKLAKLDIQLELYPKLKVCYWLKEGLRNVYKCETKKDAFQKYYEWECAINEAKKHEKIPEIIGVQKMINRLKPQVFAFFDGRYTSGKK